MTVTVIAIDGPAGAGKSTVARLVARKVGLPYLDTGAMYRCIALAVMNAEVDRDSGTAAGEIAERVSIVVEPDGVTLDGSDVTNAIRTPEVSAVVSVIAAHSRVREAMRSQQRLWIAAHGGGVVEGRDIGTVVFPDATTKIFLTASPVERAQRRVAQSGGDVDEVAAGIAERDRIDSTRADSPLKPAEDATVVDSTGLDIDQVVDRIVAVHSGRVA
mgnify:CR=1 FL=1